MELKKLSASSLQAADMCLARYYAESKAGYGATIRNNYARLGSSVHGALEDFVKLCFIEKKAYANKDFLIAYYKKHFMANFETAELSGDWYDQGIEMLDNWYEHMDFSYFEVQTVEQKKRFHVKTSIGDIPLNYVIDRFDILGPNKYRVVDYKTSNELLTPELLYKKIQARIYALAIQIEHPDAEEIWVEFDMLRFRPVQYLFTRDDQVATYRMLQRAAERIIAAKVEYPSDVKKLETLNPQCMFCIRKTNCSAVQRNVESDGIFAYQDDLEAMVNARALLEFQKKAAESAMAELETLILATMENEDLLDYETDLVSTEVGVSKRRQIDTDVIISIIGEDTFEQFGGKKTMLASDFDKMCKALPPDKAALIKAEAVSDKFGDPKLKIKLKGEFVS